MKKIALKTLVAAVSFASLGAYASVLPAHQTSDQWFKDGEATITAKLAQEQNTNKAKNVILFVGDGMGVSTQTAARILEGQMKGQTGEENFLSFEKFSNSALIKTYNTNQQTPDSAGTMTAMVTGVKTKAGVLNIAPNVLRADCKGAKGNELTSVLQFAENQGLSTGVVSTARITHATPAAAYAKSPDRNWESDDKLPEDAKKYGCQDIATQFVQFAAGDGIDVAFGGGRRHFIPKETTDLEGKSGKRTDGVDLREVWKNINEEGVYVEDQKGFDAIPANSKKVFGLFNSSHMSYEADRKNDKAGEPSLTEMTKKSIELLKARSGDKGYVLIVESGRIDHGHHAGSAYTALTDTIEYSNAVKAAQELAGDDTLIMVTADHSHVFTIAGYPTRGNPILGKVMQNDGYDDAGMPKTKLALASDELPYTTVGYTNGLGFRDLGDETNADVTYSFEADTGRKDLTKINTQAPGFHQEALVPTSAETHAGEDITLHAMGPGSAYVQGAMEQNTIFHIINKALGLNAE